MDIRQGEFSPTLQYRWRVETTEINSAVVYYGLRNYPNHLKGMLLIKPETATVVKRLNGSRSLVEVEAGCPPEIREELSLLISEGVLVRTEDMRNPVTMEHHQTCVRCVNNDYVLPGLEFNDDGVCAFCQCYEKVPDSGPVHGGTITDEELIAAARNNKGRFDVMVLYTGGKDSSYLLWYLARKLGLKVLACTWDLPFTNASSRANMRAARVKLENVEFIERTVRWEDIRRVSKALFDRVGLPCICPIIATVLFYPVAVQEKVPFIMDGVEAAQTLILSKIMSLPAKTGAAKLSDAELTLRQIRRFVEPDINSGDPWDAFLALVRDQLDSVYDPLREALKHVDVNNPPLSKRLRSETVYGSWDKVREIIERELDWRMPEDQTGLLHTSCDIETVKDWSQFRRFAEMRTRQMPQSIIEISAALHFGQITREQALKELSERGYYRQPDALAPLMGQLGISLAEAGGCPGELPCITDGCRF